ncbi:hypothetical protein ACFE04_023709 [Oxalis oulophora]
MDGGDLSGVVPCSSLAFDGMLRAGAIWGLCSDPHEARKLGLNGIAQASFVAKSVGKFSLQCGMVAGVFTMTQCGMQRYRRKSDWLLHRQTDIYKQQPGVIFDYYLLSTYDSKTEKCISESDFTETSLNLRSSLREDIDKTTYGTFLDIDPYSGRISLRSLIDHSIVESFGGGGKSCITSRIYPKVAINKDAHLYADRGAKRMLPAEIVSNLQTQVKKRDGKKTLSITWKTYIV